MTKHAAEQAFDLMPSPTLTCMPPKQHSPRCDKAQRRAQQVHLILYPHVRSRVLTYATHSILWYPVFLLHLYKTTDADT